jgi:DNA-binding transcriptional MerR regulator
MEEPRWTLDELAERVETALAVDYHGPVSGRVRAVPDRRAIRWYTTIGLIDRPATHRGRTALYGPRHLLQLVAVKRLQARGLPLVSIQQELAGATDTQLARVARLPEGVAAGPVPGPAAARAAFVAPRPARSKARRTTFWRAQPAAFTAAAGADAITAEPAGLIPADPSALPDRTAPGRDHAGSTPAATLRGIRLGDDATLLLEPGRELGSEDLQAILDAARPLLAAVRERRLGAGAGGRDPGQDRQVPDASELDPEAPRPRASGNEPRREHP